MYSNSTSIIQQSSHKYRSLFIALTATVIRYYDYSLLGLSAAVILKTFVPGASDADKLLNFFGMFSLAVIARPLGSIIFGRIGDKMGRVDTLKITTILSAASTSLIAFIPGYEAIGIISFLLLTLCRMSFLMSLAGEIDAVRIFVIEKVGNKHRYLATGIISFSSQIGVLIAATMYHWSMEQDSSLELWRLNFLLGGMCGGGVILMRYHLRESEVFLGAKRATDNNNTFSDHGLLKLISTHKVKFILALCIDGSLGGIYQFLIIFYNTFAARIGMFSESTAEQNNILLISTYGLMCLVSGAMADKWGVVIRQIKISLAISFVCIIFMQIMIYNDIYLLYLHFCIVFLAPFYCVPCQIKPQSLFHINIRMRMCSLSHSLGGVIFSSSTPFFCMLLWKYTEKLEVVWCFNLLLVAIIFFTAKYYNKKQFMNMLEHI